MAAWSSTPDPLYDRLDDRHDEANGGIAFYECSLEDLCATIDAASESAARLADELHTLTGEIGWAA